MAKKEESTKWCCNEKCQYHCSNRTVRWKNDVNSIECITTNEHCRLVKQCKELSLNFFRWRCKHFQHSIFAWMDRAHVHRIRIQIKSVYRTLQSHDFSVFRSNVWFLLEKNPLWLDWNPRNCTCRRLGLKRHLSPSVRPVLRRRVLWRVGECNWI